MHVVIAAFTSNKMNHICNEEDVDGQSGIINELETIKRDLEKVYQRHDIGKQLQNVTKRQKVTGNDEFHYHKEWNH